MVDKRPVLFWFLIWMPDNLGFDECASEMQLIEYQGIRTIFFTSSIMDGSRFLLFEPRYGFALVSTSVIAACFVPLNPI